MRPQAGNRAARRRLADTRPAEVRRHGRRRCRRRGRRVRRPRRLRWRARATSRLCRAGSRVRSAGSFPGPRCSLRQSRADTVALALLPEACSTGCSSSGRIPSVTASPSSSFVRILSRTPKSSTSPPAAIVAGSRLIEGLPMNCATWMFAGDV